MNTKPTSKLRLDPTCPFAIENAHELRVHRTGVQRGPKKGAPRTVDPAKVQARQEAQQKAQANREARTKRLAERQKRLLEKQIRDTTPDKDGLTLAQRVEIRKEKELFRAEKKRIEALPAQERLRFLEEDVRLLKARHEAFKTEYLGAKGLLVHDSDRYEQENVFELKRKTHSILRTLNKTLEKLKAVKEEVAQTQRPNP